MPFSSNGSLNGSQFNSCYLNQSNSDTPSDTSIDNLLLDYDASNPILFNFLDYLSYPYLSPIIFEFTETLRFTTGQNTAIKIDGSYLFDFISGQLLDNLDFDNLVLLSVPNDQSLEIDFITYPAEVSLTCSPSSYEIATLGITSYPENIAVLGFLPICQDIFVIGGSTLSFDLLTIFNTDWSQDYYDGSRLECSLDVLHSGVHLISNTRTGEFYSLELLTFPVYSGGGDLEVITDSRKIVKMIVRFGHKEWIDTKLIKTITFEKIKVVGRFISSHHLKDIKITTKIKELKTPRITVSIKESSSKAISNKVIIK